MGGPDNFRGIDYQISVSLFIVLRIILGETKNAHSLQFDSLDDDEEDLNVFLESGQALLYQIKKKNESYRWTPSTIKPVFEHFLKNHSTTAQFYFITNAPGNSDIVTLKNELESGTLSQATIDLFCPQSVDQKVFLTIMECSQIHTRFFSSNDDQNPALVIEKNIKDIMTRYPFSPQDNISDVYNDI